ncbi:MAG TPA: hypothetical protein GX525_10325 [Bacilli bacterium]|jgi:N-glycosylase/DNA lyase|nr:hypothetical protein [Bacilli bacterium]
MILHSIVIEKAVQNLMCKIEITKNSNWQKKIESDLLKELTLCILSSSIKYEVALLYTEKLEKQNCFIKALNNELDAEQICEFLTEPISLNGRLIRYRFPKSKSEQLFKTINNIYGTKNTIKEILINAGTSIDARDSLTSICVGIGYKQASMFLRNVGFSYELAIIDTHIIDYLKLVDVLSPNASVRNQSEYSKVESLYSNYAKSKQFDIKKLDIAIWNVMKVYKSKFA